MTVLVTGGRGYVGRHLVNALVATGNEVVSYNRDYSVSDQPGVHAVMGELFDLPRLLTVIKSHHVDTIIHTAAQSHPEISVEVPLTTVAANIDGTAAVLEAARLANVARFVNFSSECALGNQPAGWTVDETAISQPTTPYGVTKAAGEMLGRVYRRCYGIDVVSLRITEVYGPGLWMPSLLADILTAVAHRQPVRQASGGDQGFNFVHVEDVARAALLAATIDHIALPIYNVAGDRQVTVSETVELIREIDPTADIEIGPGALPGWDQQGPYDIGAAARDLGYEPSWGLRDGLIQLLRHTRAAAGSPTTVGGR